MKQTLARYNKCLDSTETPKIVEKKPKVKLKRLAFLSSHYYYAVHLDIITRHVFCNTDQRYNVYPDAFSYAERFCSYFPLGVGGWGTGFESWRYAYRTLIK